MLNFNFNANDYEEKTYEPIPVGDYRIRVENAEETVSKSSGKDMVKLTFAVSGKSSKLFFYLVIDPADQKATNQRFGTFWDSFGIPFGNSDPQSWIGKVGACRVIHEDYQGEPQAKVKYLINRKKQAALPAWVEPPASGSGSMPKGNYVSPAEPPMPDPDFPPPPDVPFDPNSLI
ncbi:MAG: DUF669 domain-containing protein [Ruminococcus sp.]|nr:DUF669 domain-containing protein [Ruminococcus sp.]